MMFGKTQDGLAGLADVADKDAQGDTDEDGDAHGDGGQADMLQEQVKNLAAVGG